MTESWKKDAEGNIMMCPVVAFELLISTAPAPRVSMHLRFTQAGDLPNKPTGTTQVVLTPAHARQLARALAGAAEQAVGGSAQETPETIDLGTLNNLS